MVFFLSRRRYFFLILVCFLNPPSMNRFITWEISQVMNLFIMGFEAQVVNVGVSFFMLIKPPYVKMAAGSERPSRYRREDLDEYSGREARIFIQIFGATSLVRAWYVNVGAPLSSYYKGPPM